MISKSNFVNGWNIFNGSDSEWDQILFGFNVKNVYQSSFHGNYFKLLGWPVMRFVYIENDKIVSLFQSKYKKLLGKIYIFISLGGPIGNIEHLIDIKNSQGLNAFGISHYLFRFFIQTEYNNVLYNLLLKNGINAYKTPRLSGLSAILDLTKSREEIMNGFNSNWKKNIRKAKNLGLYICKEDKISAEKIIEFYRILEKKKNIDITFTNDEINALIDSYGKNLIIMTCRLLESKEVLSVRGAIIFGDFALDYIAVTGELGRKLFASHLLTSEYIYYLQEIGIKHFDFSGINPEIGMGVYQFKRGSGAKEIKYLGEFEIISSKFIGLLIRTLLHSKMLMQRLRKRLNSHLRRA